MLINGQLYDLALDTVSILHFYATH